MKLDYFYSWIELSDVILSPQLYNVIIRIYLVRGA